MRLRIVGIRWKRLGGVLAFMPLAAGCGKSARLTTAAHDSRPAASAPALLAIDEASPLTGVSRIERSSLVVRAQAEGEPLFGPPPTGAKSLAPAEADDGPASRLPRPKLRSKISPAESEQHSQAPPIQRRQPQPAPKRKAPAKKPDLLTDNRAPKELFVDAARPLPGIEDDAIETSRIRRDFPRTLAQSASPARSREMDAVARRAAEHVARGHDLAARGATYSARAEFIQALRLLSQALDALQETNQHGRALAAGLKALEECDDFMPRGSHLDAEIDVAALAAGHRTPVLDFRLARETSSLVAVQMYLTYAQEQLGSVAEDESAGSMALYGLGKLLALEEKRQPGASPGAEPKAMALYQAALFTHPGNYQAANELAVLVARTGQLERSRDLLQQAVSFARRPELWQNLAAVHRELGETSLAQQADRQARLAANVPDGRSLTGAVPSVQWVQPRDLAERTQPIDISPGRPAAPSKNAGQVARRDRLRPTAPEDAPADPESSSTDNDKGIRSWFPWLTR